MNTSNLQRTPADRDAVEALVESHQPLVHALARRYTTWGLELSELISEGNAAMLQAAERFDPKRGVAFSSYAIPWIQHAIRSACTRGPEVIALPKPIRRLVTKYRRLLAGTEPGNMPSNREIAAQLGITRETLDVVIEAATRRRLTSSSRDGKPEQDVLASISSDTQSDPLLRMEENDQIVELRSALADLPAAELQVVRLHFGMDGEPPLRSEEIAHRLHIPLVRVISSLQKALGHLEAHMGHTKVA